MEEAGFPGGVINVITHAPGEAVPIADEVFDRPEVRCINFTGSSATGRILAERAGRALKRCVLELGGYNPLIVLADADLDYAVEAAAFAAFFHSGQICMNARKVLVEQSVYETFIDRLTARAKPRPPGTGWPARSTRRWPKGPRCWRAAAQTAPATGRRSWPTCRPGPGSTPR